jgi:hypothetical protein
MAPATGSYVYGVVFADDAAGKHTRGVGDNPGLEFVRHERIAALTSEVDLNRPLGTPDDLIAHERVLDAAAARGPVLPMRFGSVMTSGDAVKGELLADHYDELVAALDDLKGRAEFVVRGRYAQDVILTEVLRENPDAARLADDIRGKDSTVTMDARIRLGELVSAAIAAKREADTAVLAEALAPDCAGVLVREPTHDTDAAYLALLADRDCQAVIEKKLSRLAEKWEGRVGLELLGPLAPYDFVMSAAPAS